MDKKRDLIRFTEVKTVSVDIPELSTMSEKEIINQSKLCEIEDTVFLYFLDWNYKEIIIINLYSNEIDKVLIKDSDSLIVIDKKTDIKIINNDTIIVFSDTDQKIMLTNSKGQLISVINLQSEFVKNNSIYFLSYFDRDFINNKSSLYFNIAYTDLLLNSKESFIEYFSRPLGAVVNLRDTDISINKIFFPFNYREGNYYGSFDYFSCFNNRDEMICSFGNNDSLFIYKNNNCLNQINAKGVKNTCSDPVKIDNLSNLSYLREYIIVNSFYQKIIYDKYRNKYLRLFKQKSSFLNKEGNIRKNSELNWSIIILDEMMKIINEIDMDPSKYSMYRIYPFNDGIFIINSLDKCLQNHKIYYSIYEIKYN